MDKLKPCPCCGSERVDTLKGNWMESEEPFWKVWCKSCQLRTWCEPTRKGAISVWNTRATDTALAAAEARIAELEKALEPFALTGKMIPTDFSDFEVMTIYASAQHLRRAAALLKEKE